MTVSERIPFSGLLLPLQEGYTYSCDRRTTDGMELLFISREDGRSRYYFESDMQEFDRNKYNRRTISEKMILRKLNVIVALCIWKKDVSHRELLLCSNCNGFCNTNEDN